MEIGPCNEGIRDMCSWCLQDQVRSTVLGIWKLWENEKCMVLCVGSLLSIPETLARIESITVCSTLNNPDFPPLTTKAGIIQAACTYRNGTLRMLAHLNVK